MLRLLSVLVLFALPAAAEVSHSFQTRFGVGYTAEAGQGRMQALYEGRYTARFSRESDSGMLFRFDLGLVVSNFSPDNPLLLRPATSGLGIAPPR